MDRRRFIHLASFSGLALLAPSCRSSKEVPTRILGASAQVGHLLRDPRFAEPARTLNKEVVIIGGGISGLSAARSLHRGGMQDFLLLDLEERMGGNAASGRNEISAFPLGAHYIPTPNNDLPEYLSFLQEAGVITGVRDGLPIYQEYHLCMDPQERLYINGRWQEGVIPSFGLPEDERRQTAAFLAEMDGFRRAKGKDGLDAFAIPVDRSSKDPAFTELDRLTMKDWMRTRGYTSAHLHWYVNYCTRDDFGTDYGQTSAWAGIQYFAGRKGKGTNAGHGDLLTWPEGNDFLVKALLQDISVQVRPRALATSVRLVENGVEIRYVDLAAKETIQVNCRQCILAVPQFVAARLLGDEARLQTVKEEVHYAPWMVANLKVRTLSERSGAPLSWDNVIYGSESLGYVNATQQLIGPHLPMRNLTYYLPLTNDPPAEARRKAMSRKPEEWKALILADLKAAHPDIEEAVDEISIQLWGHAMAQPRPGWIHGEQRGLLARTISDRIHFAHTDLAGISIFEEGFYQGLQAAERVLLNQNKPGI